MRVLNATFIGLFLLQLLAQSIKLYFGGEIMTKKLFDALSSINYTVVSCDGKTPIESDKSANPEINSLVFDSRDVKPGSLFFALPGTHTTGNVFIPKAIENGAAAIVFQGELEISNEQGAISNSSLHIPHSSLHKKGYPAVEWQSSP